MKTILIADDDPDILSVVKIRLNKFGYRVLTAENGATAFLLAKQQHPNLIILDIKMPCGNGLSTYDKLKDSIETAFIPVIFFTAHPSADIRKKVMEWGASNFIAKPFTTQELIFKVKSALFEKLSKKNIVFQSSEDKAPIKTMHSYSLIG